MVLTWNKIEDYSNCKLFNVYKSCLFEIAVFRCNGSYKVHHIYSEQGSRCGATDMATVLEAVMVPAPL